MAEEKHTLIYAAPGFWNLLSRVVVAPTVSISSARDLISLLHGQSKMCKCCQFRKTKSY